MSRANGLLFDCSVGGTRVCTATCSPRQGGNRATGWGVTGGNLVMCSVSFTLSGDRLSWSFGGSTYYDMRTQVGQPLTFVDGAASTVTRIVSW